MTYKNAPEDAHVTRNREVLAGAKLTAREEAKKNLDYAIEALVLSILERVDCDRESATAMALNEVALNTHRRVREIQRSSTAFTMPTDDEEFTLESDPFDDDDDEFVPFSAEEAAELPPRN